MIPCPGSLQGVSCRKITGATRHPRETGIRVSASFPAAVGHTHWDWSSSNPALPLRGLTRERLSALDAGPHVASSACYCPPNPFGRRSADRFTRLLPAGSGLSRQDQTNLYHGALLRSITPKWAMWELTTRGFSSNARTFPGPGGDRGCERASVPVRAFGPRAFSAVMDHVSPCW